MQREKRDPDQIRAEAPKPRKDFTGWIGWTQPEGASRSRRSPGTAQHVGASLAAAAAAGTSSSSRPTS